MFKKIVFILRFYHLHFKISVKSINVIFEQQKDYKKCIPSADATSRSSTVE